jgi:hypothetical protein
MHELKSELLFEVHFNLAPPHVIPGNPNGTRQIVGVIDGKITKGKFGAEALTPGGDWLRVRHDGIFELDVRGILQLDDDCLAYMTYGGVIVVSQENFGRIVQGEELDSSEYYFRTTPRFETGSEKYGWLNNIITVGIGKVGPGLQWVEYSVFQIL